MYATFKCKWNLENTLLLHFVKFEVYYFYLIIIFAFTKYDQPSSPFKMFMAKSILISELFVTL